VALVTAMAVVPGAVHAQSVPGVTCSMQQGVYVCTDNTTGPSGPVCIVETATGKQTCLTNGGGSSSSVVGQLGKGFGKVIDLPGQTSGTGWLSKLTGWIANVVHTFFVAIVQVLKDLVTYVLSTILDLVADAISSISPPDFLTNYSMGALLGQAGPIVGFFLSQLRVGEGLAIVGAGYAFRLLRKFLTLFQW
jgi:hypothetical protein